MSVLATVLALAALTPPVQESSKPKLVVVIGVDQLIPEQLDRLAPYFTGGYGRFVREGHAFRSAMLEHANTETGPGYATLGTGCHPNKNGIVSNGWFNSEGTGSVYCVGDPDVPLVDGAGVPESTGPGISPRNIRMPGLGDWMKSANENSRVVSLAGKDRAAVGMGGKQPDLCVWWNRSVGGFTSSAWYGPELPEWLSEWNAELPARVFADEWSEGWATELPDGIESAGTAPDERVGERSVSRALDALKAGSGEPDLLKQRGYLGYAGYYTPITDLLTIELAGETVSKYGLGEDEHPDVLFIGLSGCDVVGHTFGPYSVEVTDLLLRGDVALGALFDSLDEKIGKNEWSAVLTADHGVLMLPEEAQRRGIHSERVPEKVIDETLAALRAHSVESFGQDFIALAASDGIRLNHAALNAAGVESAAVQAGLATWLREVEWVERVFVQADLEGELSTTDSWKRLTQRCFDPERSPEVVIQSRPWALLEMTAGTSHGSPYPYDRSIPLVFMGPDIRPSRRFDAASTADVAPTVLNLLGIEPPSELDGRPLELNKQPATELTRPRLREP